MRKSPLNKSTLRAKHHETLKTLNQNPKALKILNMPEALVLRTRETPKPQKPHTYTKTPQTLALEVQTFVVSQAAAEDAPEILHTAAWEKCFRYLPFTGFRVVRVKGLFPLRGSVL